MNRPVVSTTRAILFRRAYNDDSGLPDYLYGSTRTEVIPFDTDVQKFFLVQRIIDHPEDLAPYLIGPIKSVRVFPHGDDPYNAVEFAMSTKLTDELRDIDVPRYVNHIDPTDRAADHDHEVSMTFNVSHHAAKLELVRWIEAKLFHAFVHEDAAIYYTAITNVTERPRFRPPYRPAHPMAVPISNPFAVAAPAQPAPAQPAPADNESEDSGIPPPVAADDDDDDDDGWDNDELQPVPVPVPGQDITDSQMLRRISDELFAVQQEMPDQVYVRLSNALKRRRDGSSA